MTKIKTVQITKNINAPLADCFNWFYHSENFTASPIVFSSRWHKKKYDLKAERDIIMIAGWYHEQITAVKENSYIQYRVLQSFSKVKQDFTEIKFEPTAANQTKVTWTIELGIPTQFLLNLGSKMAKTLYTTLITAGKKQLEG